MDSKTIRYRNTRYLVDLAGGVSNFAEKIGKGQSQTSQFSGSTPIKGIGNKIAREIEVAFKKEYGWLDIAHPELWGELRSEEIQSQGDQYSSQYQSINPAPPMVSSTYVIYGDATINKEAALTGTLDELIKRLMKMDSEGNLTKDFVKSIDSLITVVEKAQETQDQVANGASPDSKSA